MALLVTGLIVAAAGCWQPFDFDNDHRADWIVFHIDPSGPTFTYRDGRDGTVLATAPSGATEPVPQDYDGDGAYDPAWLSGSGSWVTNSERGTIRFPPTGRPACSNERLRAVPADYDGDRAANPAYYCGSTGTWYIEGRDPTTFGDPAVLGDVAAGEDIAVPADYDGDEKADLAVFNPATMLWRVLESRTGVISSVTMHGNEGLALPVPADYEGTGGAQRATVGPDGWVIDGNDEPIAFPRPSTSYDEWDEVFNQYNLPVPADYDGDNYVDLAMSGSRTILHTEDYEDPEIVDARPWSQRSADDAYREVVPSPGLSGWVVHVQSVRQIVNLSLYTSYACDLPSSTCF